MRPILKILEGCVIAVLKTMGLLLMKQNIICIENLLLGALLDLDQANLDVDFVPVPTRRAKIVNWAMRRTQMNSNERSVI